MPLGDLRAWLEHVEQLGELRTIRGAHWNAEIGAASELNLRAPKPAALLFEAIPDYPPGYRVVTCSNAAPSRLGLSLGLGSGPASADLNGLLPGQLDVRRL